MEAFEREERSLVKVDVPYTRIMRKGWEIGNYWYLSALDCLNGLCSLYITHIRRKFAKPEDSGAEFDRTVSAYWSTDAAEFIAAKLRDKEVYCSQLRQKFAAKELRKVDDSEHR